MKVSPSDRITLVLCQQWPPHSHVLVNLDIRSLEKMSDVNVSYHWEGGSIKILTKCPISAYFCLMKNISKL